MTLGDFLIQGIVTGGLIHIVEVDLETLDERGEPEVDYMFVWSGNSEEQLDAMFHEWLDKWGLELAKKSQ